MDRELKNLIVSLNVSIIIEDKVIEIKKIKRKIETAQKFFIR